MVEGSTSTKEIVTCAIGRRDSAGHWIVTSRVDVQAFDTGVSQLVITPDLAGRPGYNLTHVQSGFRCLGPFVSLTNAREAAVKLAKIFPIDDWNALGAMSQSWKRSQVKRMFRALPPEDQEWMRQNGARL